jgi:large subunit ribosomal protein L7Ae
MAPSKKSTKKVVTPKASKKADPMFPARARSTRIGGDVRPQGRDLSRFVKWPKYVRVQRQRAILYQRLKVPPVINQFTKAVNTNEAASTFKLLNNYRPATPAAKRAATKAKAAAKAAGTEAPAGKEFELKYGLKHITTLVEDKKAKLVVIACDVDPVELVVWLPALCRKMEVPFMIIKDKARLGALVHQKNAAALAITGVDKSDEKALANLVSMATEQFNDNKDLVRKWGGGIVGLKTSAKLEKRAKAQELEAAKKAKSQGL